MTQDVAEVIGDAVGRVARNALQNASVGRRRRNGALSGNKAVAAGLGIGAMAPLAVRGARKLVKGSVPNPVEPLKKAGGKLGDAGGKLGNATDAVSSVAEKAGGGDDGDDGGGKSKGVPGVGKGRRMPIQQDIDIGVPLETVYNEWTQFEDWPKFMHRVQQISQEDETHLSFKAKIWGISKEFKAEIVEQRPDERIKWRVTEGLVHNGVVTFHELAPRLTRVEVNLDVEPGSMIEKAARGMRHVKRAVRADLARFKAHVLMEEEASGEWRGTVEDGDVKKTRAQSSGGSSRSSASSGRSSASSGRSSASSSRSSSRSKSSSSGNRRRSSGGSRSSSNGRGSSSSGRSRSSSKRSSSNSGGGGSRSSRSKSGSRS
ncbi:MAG: SRPBCC family protein [Gaiellaceae bacterium]